MFAVPEGAPASLAAASAQTHAAIAAGVTDLQIMVFAEAAGKSFYGVFAGAVPAEWPHVREVLLRNGREEVGHAHRVSRALEFLTGTAYPVPEPEENPYLIEAFAARRSPVDAAALTALAQTEFEGETLYRSWAANCEDPRAAALLSKNGAEERRHGLRLLEAAELMSR